MLELEPVPSSYPVVLDGGRLRLREVGLADLDDAWAWSSDERFFRYLPVELPADREAERLGLHRIWATHHPENVASRRVLDRLGFREEGRRRDDRMIGGQWSDSVVCSLLEDEWRAVPPSDAG